MSNASTQTPMLFPYEPEKFWEVEELTACLHTSILVYNELVKNKILHHHHVPKLICITAGLSIVVTLVCAGWYSTSNKLDEYIANDTKYRQLRLDTAYKGLQSYLDMT